MEILKDFSQNANQNILSKIQQLIRSRLNLEPKLAMANLKSLQRQLICKSRPWKWFFSWLVFVYQNGNVWQMLVYISDDVYSQSKVDSIFVKYLKSKWNI